MLTTIGSTGGHASLSWPWKKQANVSCKSDVWVGLARATRIIQPRTPATRDGAPPSVAQGRTWIPHFLSQSEMTMKLALSDFRPRQGMPSSCNLVKVFLLHAISPRYAIHACSSSSASENLSLSTSLVPWDAGWQMLCFQIQVFWNASFHGYHYTH